MQPSECQNESNKWWWNVPVSNLSFDKTPLYKESITCKEAIHISENTKSKQLVISNDDKHVKGVVMLHTLMSNLLSGTVKLTDCVEKTMIKHYVKVKSTARLGQLSRVLEKEPYAVILDGEHDFIGIVDQSHILNFVHKNDSSMNSNK